MNYNGVTPRVILGGNRAAKPSAAGTGVGTGTGAGTGTGVGAPRSTPTPAPALTSSPPTTPATTSATATTKPIQQTQFAPGNVPTQTQNGSITGRQQTSTSVHSKSLSSPNINQTSSTSTPTSSSQKDRTSSLNSVPQTTASASASAANNNNNTSSSSGRPSSNTSSGGSISRSGSGANDQGGSVSEIYQLIVEQKLTENEIWGGHPDLFPILFQFPNVFKSSTGQDTGSSHLLTVNLPNTPEFGGTGTGAPPKKCGYKIGKKLTVAQTINLICKKQNSPADPHRYYLKTLYGCVLDEEQLLSTYGFGTFFTSWELSLVAKDAYATMDSILLAQQHQVMEPTEFIIDFQLPPLKQLQGLKKKRLKVDSSMTIGQIIDNICTKFKINDPERFSILTNEEFPLQLHRDASLAHYGLGNKVAGNTPSPPGDNIELNIVFNEFIPPYTLRSNVVPSFGALQMGATASGHQQRQRRAALVELENKLHESIDLNRSLAQRFKDVAGEAKEHEDKTNQQITEMEASHNYIMQRIVQQLTVVKENFMQEKEGHKRQLSIMLQEKSTMVGERDRLTSENTRLASELGDAGVKAYQERASHTEVVLKLNDTIDSMSTRTRSLEEKVAEQGRRNDELDTALKASQASLDRAKADAQKDEVTHMEQLKQMELEHDELRAKSEGIIREIYKRMEVQKQGEDQRIQALTQSLKQSEEQRIQSLTQSLKQSEEQRIQALTQALKQEVIVAVSTQKEVEQQKIQTITQTLKQSEEQRIQALKQSEEQRIQSITQSLKQTEEQRIQALKQSEEQRIQALKQTEEQRILALKLSEEQRIQSITQSLKQSEEQRIQALKQSEEQRIQALKQSEEQRIQSITQTLKQETNVANIERENMRSAINKLTEELKEKDNIIRSVHPKKIETLEQSIKQLEARMEQTERDSKLNKQQATLRSMEVDELKRQMELQRVSSQEQVRQVQGQLDRATNQSSDEEGKFRKLNQDFAAIKAELETERYKNEHITKSLNDVKQAKLDQEAAFRAKEQAMLTSALSDHHHVVAPVAPPLPSSSSSSSSIKNNNNNNRVPGSSSNGNNNRSPDVGVGRDDCDSIITSESLSGAKNTLRAVPNIAPAAPLDRGVSSIAEILRASMQKRFNAMNQVDFVELDDVDDGEFQD
ncbi:hypothetical protein SAMD00019534_060410 [Acytostelium subglobosum LB1]|uniref:hypothetical protein n=1 Tax=Acytostelium subglobosum LB1 TaxID=1410327 RepID=UPI000644A578|nr:hypothetical protein SAMD00019534_060410 [Acytostelium subglobosum LB1]GAM22866.1 hypothetical protein SAMD00019534_060410 [Acytostelium subglobosum LB1]|eukprot:XP_012754093.1 hypothetical protein SAMD00019534_060410 [Acytostelium subglobosum LB1]